MSNRIRKRKQRSAPAERCRIKGLFITGTDTGVGKTFIASGLISAMKGMGLAVCPMKPVESGCRTRGGVLVPGDAGRLMAAAGIDEPMDLVNPYRLKHPLAPAVAATIEGVRIKRSRLLYSYRKLRERYDMIFVEGAGGIMVPVYNKYLFIDLAADLGLPVLIVSRPGLGTINHTLLTVCAARARGMDIAGVVFNCSGKQRSGLPEKTSPDVIKKLGGVRILGRVDFMKEPSIKKKRRTFEKIASDILRLKRKGDD